MAHAFRHADVVLVSAVDRPDKAPAGQVFSCDRLIADLQQNRQEAYYIEKVNDMVPFLLARLKPEDVVITFSNGFFGGIHDKLLQALRQAEA